MSDSLQTRNLPWKIAKKSSVDCLNLPKHIKSVSTNLHYCVLVSSYKVRLNRNLWWSATGLIGNLQTRLVNLQTK